MIKVDLLLRRTLAFGERRPGGVQILCNHFLKLTSKILCPEDATVGCGQRSQGSLIRGRRPP